MKNKQSFSKGKKFGSSMIMKRPRFTGTDRAKYPALAEKIIQMSDIILEVLDSRYISSTRNAEIETQIKKQGKKIIYVLNKSDLIDIRKVNEDEIIGLSPKSFVSCTERNGGKELRNKIKMTAQKVDKPVDKFLGKITVGVIGYPNTGKSSVINYLVGKPAAGVGSDAGFTHGIQKVNLTSGIVLIDSPGVIPKKEYSTSNVEAMARNTKVGARSYSQVKDPAVAITNIMKDYSSVLEKFYNVSANGDAEILMEKIGRQKGLLKKGDEVDEDKTARLILKDWQTGKIKI